MRGASDRLFVLHTFYFEIMCIIFRFSRSIFMKVRLRGGVCSQEYSRRGDWLTRWGAGAAGISNAGEAGLSHCLAVNKLRFRAVAPVIFFVVGSVADFQTREGIVRTGGSGAGMPRPPFFCVDYSFPSAYHRHRVSIGSRFRKINNI